MFVDDPRSSVELAAGLVDDSVESIVMSVKEQQHHCCLPGKAMIREPRNCARHSGIPHILEPSGGFLP